MKEFMKVSVDYFFKRCKYCPFIALKAFPEDEEERYSCKIGGFNVSGDNIPNECPLRKDDKDKIYKISNEVH